MLPWADSTEDDAAVELVRQAMLLCDRKGLRAAAALATALHGVLKALGMEANLAIMCAEEDN